ncbi:hypothetical protein ACQEVZ_27945 [Dactylosporangium sp. CA-152071]|uniref:hypothetical protein n=1 Tax=Dactylosporangium sp. CA-152071 TaxID=3239933 RepID=UPI003D9168E4
MTSATEAAAPASATVRDITARFHHLATTQPDRVAIIDRHRSTTFADLWQLAYQDAVHRPADQTIVPVAARPDAATMAAALGVWLTGGIPLPVPAAARLKTLNAAVQRATGVAHTCRPWRAYLHAEPGARHICVTGGVPPTDRRLGDAIGLTSGGTALITAPLHAAAIFEAAVRQLLAGGTIVLRHEFEPDDWLATAVETGADWAVLAAEQLIALIRHQEAIDGWLPVATRALRRVVVPAAVPAVNTGYLAALTTHAGAAVTAWYHAPAYDGALSRAGGPPNVLTPLPGIHLRIVDPCGRPTPHGVAGLIEASSSRGATSHRADLPCTPAGAWRTAGDIGTLDTDGNLTLRRLEPARHYLDPAGARVTVAALRETLDAHPDITAHTIHVVPDDDGQRRARVQVWTRTALNPAAVARHCAGRGTATSAAHIIVNDARSEEPFTADTR